MERVDDLIFVDCLYLVALINSGHCCSGSVNDSWYAPSVRITYVELNVLIGNDTYIGAGKTIALSARYRFACRPFSMNLAKLMASIDAVKLN